MIPARVHALMLQAALILAILSTAGPGMADPTASFYVFARYWPESGLPTLGTQCPTEPLSSGTVRALIGRRLDTEPKGQIRAITIKLSRSNAEIQELSNDLTTGQQVNRDHTPETWKLIQDLSTVAGDPHAVQEDPQPQALAALLCRSDGADAGRRLYHVDTFLSRKTTDPAERKAIQTLACIAFDVCNEPATFSSVPTPPSNDTRRYSLLLSSFAEALKALPPVQTLPSPSVIPPQKPATPAPVGPDQPSQPACADGRMCPSDPQPTPAPAPQPPTPSPAPVPTPAPAPTPSPTPAPAPVPDASQHANGSSLVLSLLGFIFGMAGFIIAVAPHVRTSLARPGGGRRPLRRGANRKNNGWAEDGDLMLDHETATQSDQSPMIQQRLMQQNDEALAQRLRPYLTPDRDLSGLISHLQETVENQNSTVRYLYDEFTKLSSEPVSPDDPYMQEVKRKADRADLMKLSDAVSQIKRELHQLIKQQAAATNEPERPITRAHQAPLASPTAPVSTPIVSTPATPAPISTTELVGAWCRSLTNVTGHALVPPHWLAEAPEGKLVAQFLDWLIAAEPLDRADPAVYQRVDDWLTRTFKGHWRLIIPEVDDIMNPDTDEIGDYGNAGRGNLKKILAVIRPGLRRDDVVITKARVVVPL